jgi:membrane protein required for colicin V production
MSLHFTFVDLLVVLIILGSMGYAIWKGFIAETLSIVAWAAGAFASLYLGQWVGAMLHPLIGTYWISMIVGYVAVFLVVFIPLSFAAYRIADNIRRSEVGPIDRILGATFGIVRGLAIIGIAYLMFTAFVRIDDQPGWLTGARTLPLIQTSAEVVMALVPNHHTFEGQRAPDDHRGPPPKSIRDLIQHPNGAPPVTPPGNADVPKPPKSHKPPKKGYGAHDRRELDRLFETTGSGGSGKP